MPFGDYEKRWGRSAYTQLPRDPQAFVLRHEALEDHTQVLQAAINHVKDSLEFGIVFVEEGDYFFSDTVYIPRCIRVIGFGNRRPRFILRENSPKFRRAEPGDKGDARYLLWFTSLVPRVGGPVQDATPGTFYSALSNIDIELRPGNPAAVGIRSHFAQHCFISHCDIHAGDCKAGIFEIGNEMEDVRFFGGDYGIYTTKPAPGWPFMMADTHFQGQRVAAIEAQEGGLTIVRMTVRDAPVAIQTRDTFAEKLYMEDCRLENISDAVLKIACEKSPYNQINLRDVHCKNAPTLAILKESGTVLPGRDGSYVIQSFTHGLQTDAPGIDRPYAVKTACDLQPLADVEPIQTSDIPLLPDSAAWHNARDLGAIGDGIADDTAALQAAIDKFDVVYLPQGMYRVTDTIRLRGQTQLIGLHPLQTQILVCDNTESFGGFGGPKPVVETEKGGGTVLSGIGIEAGGANTRAAGVKWRAGADSYMNDVKFLGGHGGLHPVYNANHSADANPDRRWDNQYWSLWITEGGGGTFKDVWTASTYASAGLMITDTSTPGRVYAMSLEHHAHAEAILRRVENWKFFAFQFEEEWGEGQQCQPIIMDRCKNLTLANFYTFRVIWLPNPFPYAVKSYGNENIEFLNVHNYTQVKFTIDNVLHDVNTDLEIRPWQIARTVLSGREQPPRALVPRQAVRLATGFDFADGAAVDSRGNLYFIDGNRKAIFRYNVQTHRVETVWDCHLKPLSLAFDSQDNLLVVVEYFPSKKATVNGKPEVYEKFEGGGRTSYGVYYNVGSTLMCCAFDPDVGEAGIRPIAPTPAEDARGLVKVFYPANRWRDTHDYMTATLIPPKLYYVAPDGVTAIAVTFDLIRSNALLAAEPNRPFLAVDEYYKRVIRFDADERCNLHNARVFIERGEYSVAEAVTGDVFVTDGQLYRYDAHGEQQEEFLLPERPSCVVPGGANNDILFVTARKSVYAIALR